MARNKPLIFAIVLILSVAISTASSSATGRATNGISLAPFQQQITINQNDQSKSFDLLLTNHTKSLQELDLSLHDFGSMNDTGGVLLDGSANYSERYGLVSWLSLSTDTVVLNAGETRSVTVTVDNRSSLQPGGHYGAVVASVNSLGEQSGNRVVINQQLLSLILVDKVGGEHFDLRLDQIGNDGNWLHLPSTVRLRFQNPGNVHVIPRGIVKLIGPSGDVLSQGIVNDGSAFILPESYRDIYVTMTPVGSLGWLPGSYQLVVQYRYDGFSKVATKIQRINFINLKLVMLIIVMAIVGLMLYKRKKRGRKPKSI